MRELRFRKESVIKLGGHAMKRFALPILLVCTVFLVTCPTPSAASDEKGPGEDEEIKLLSQQLRSGEIQDRVAAARKLGKIKSEAAFTALVSALTTREEEVRKMVITAVASFETSKAAEALDGIFDDCNINTKLHIIKRLSGYDNKGETKVFLRAVKDKKDEYGKVKKEALKQLNKRRDHEGVLDVFLKIMDSRDEYELKGDIVGGVPLEPKDDREMKILVKGLKEKRRANVAFMALGRLESMKLAPGEKLDLALLTSKSKFSTVRGKLVDVLKKIGTEDAVKNLLKMLRSEKTTSNSEKICMALGEIGGERAAKGLSQNILHRDMKIRLAAVQALGNIQNDISRKALRKALRDDDEDIVTAAIQGLARFKTPDVIKDLTRAAPGDAPFQIHAEVIKALKLIDHPESVDALVKILERAENVNVKIEAVKALGDMKAGEAVEPITREIKRYIGSEERDVRKFLRSTIETLAKIGGPETEDAMILLTRSKIQDIRQDALAKMGGFTGEAAVKTLTRACSDPVAAVRLSALRSIRNSLHPDAVSAVTRLLKDPDDKVRLLAIETLGDYALPETAADLARDYDDEKSYRAAVVALSGIDSKDSRRFLLKALEHPDGEIRLCALAGLGLPWARGDREVAKKLIAYLEVEETAPYRLAAIAALGNTAADEAITKLQELCNSDTVPEALAAVEALGHTKSERAAGFLLKILKTCRYSIKEKVIYALGEIGCEEAVEPLAKLLKEKDSGIKSISIEALGKFNTDEAKKAVLACLDDNSTTVVGAAVRVLAKYRGDAEVLQAVLKLMESDRARIRETVAELLPLYASHDVVPTLLAYYKDDSSRNVRANCLKSLRRLMNRDLGEEAEDWNKWWMAERDTPVKELVDEGFRQKGYGITGNTDRKTVGEYIRALADENDYIRHNAVTRLREIAGREFGYDPDAKSNQKALEKWKQWWAKNEGRFK